MSGKVAKCKQLSCETQKLDVEKVLVQLVDYRMIHKVFT